MLNRRKRKVYDKEYPQWDYNSLDAQNSYIKIHNTYTTANAKKKRLTHKIRKL